MADFISPDAYQECTAYIESLQQRLAGRSVPREELIDLFHELIARIAQAYQEELVGANAYEYQTWSDEDLIAGAGAMAELRRCLGLQREGWEGLEVTNQATTFEVAGDIEDLVDLYLGWERDLGHVLNYIAATLSWAIMRSMMGKRTAQCPVGHEVVVALLRCLHYNDTASLERFKKTLPLGKIARRSPPREVEDYQALVTMNAWRVTAKSWAKWQETPVGPSRVPPGWDDLGVAGGWQALTERLEPRIRIARGVFLPILRGEADKYPQQAYQALRDYWEGQISQKRRGSPKRIEVPVDLTCPFCHHGDGTPALRNPRYRQVSYGVLICTKCGIAFATKPDRQGPAMFLKKYSKTIPELIADLSDNRLDPMQLLERKCRLGDAYRIAAKLFRDRGVQLLNAYLEHGNAVEAGKVVGMNRNTVKAWFDQIRAADLLESPPA